MARRKAAGGARSPFATGAVQDATFTVGAEAANVIITQVQFKDHRGQNVASRVRVFAYLSDDAAGATPVATAPSGAVAASTNGAVPDTGAAKKSFLLISTATGRVDVSITEAGAKTLYLNVVLPDGTVKTSGAITFAA